MFEALLDPVKQLKMLVLHICVVLFFHDMDTMFSPNWFQTFKCIYTICLIVNNGMLLVTQLHFFLIFFFINTQYSVISNIQDLFGNVVLVTLFVFFGNTCG